MGAAGSRAQMCCLSPVLTERQAPNRPIPISLPIASIQLSSHGRRAAPACRAAAARSGEGADRCGVIRFGGRAGPDRRVCLAPVRGRAGVRVRLVRRRARHDGGCDRRPRGGGASAGGWAPVPRGRGAGGSDLPRPRRAQLLYRTAADSLSLGAPSQTVLGQAAAASVRLKSAKCLVKLHKYNEAIQEVPHAARLLSKPRTSPTPSTQLRTISPRVRSPAASVLLTELLCKTDHSQSTRCGTAMLRARPAAARPSLLTGSRRPYRRSQAALKESLRCARARANGAVAREPA